MLASIVGDYKKIQPIIHINEKPEDQDPQVHDVYAAALSLGLEILPTIYTLHTALDKLLALAANDAFPYFNGDKLKRQRNYYIFKHCLGINVEITEYGLLFPAGK